MCGRGEDRVRVGRHVWSIGLRYTNRGEEKKEKRGRGWKKSR